VQVPTNVTNNLARFWRWTKSMAHAAGAQKKVEVTVETDQILIIRRRRFTRGWCRECGREVELARLEDVAAIAGTSGPQLHDGMAQPWHFADSAERWVCLESLSTRRR
jgi:hypothetical protein